MEEAQQLQQLMKNNSYSSDDPVKMIKISEVTVVKTDGEEDHLRMPKVCYSNFYGLLTVSDKYFCTNCY